MFDSINVAFCVEGAVVVVETLFDCVTTSDDTASCAVVDDPCGTKTVVDADDAVLCAESIGVDAVDIDWAHWLFESVDWVCSGLCDVV